MRARGADCVLKLLPWIAIAWRQFAERMLAHGVAPIGVRGNFTFGSGGLQFSPHRYNQFAVPGCIQLPEAKRHSCPVEPEML